MKCPIVSDKSKIEFPCLPETEYSEVVLQLNNESNRNFTFEVVPPNPKVSGIIVNPLVKPLPANRSTLVSIRYESAFRDLGYWTMKDLNKPQEEETAPKGLIQGARNKKLEARIKANKAE